MKSEFYLKNNKLIKTTIEYKNDLVRENVVVSLGNPDTLVLPWAAQLGPDAMNEYSIPMGVWIVRETARKAFINMKRFSTKEDALEYVKTKLRVPLEYYMKTSKILKQRRIRDFF